MKTIQRTLLASLVPLLTPMTALAQTGNQAERSNQPDRSNAVQNREGDGHSWRASNVLGKDVKNAGSETIGEVEDLVIDMENGEVIAVIISTGGFLGIGEAMSAVPVAVLRYDEQAEGFKTKLTKEQLERAPQFKADSWPDYSDTTSSEALRSFRATLDDDTTTRNQESSTHNQDATSRNQVTTTGSQDNTARNQGVATGSQDSAARNQGDTSRNADNTAQNKKDVNRDQTPMDQGNSKEDIKMTKDIRSEIMDTDMSANAKNIKIISRNGSLTLNGVVKSESEHQEILKISEKHCDEGKITDNLQVKND